MMDFKQIVKQRYAPKKFKNKKIPREKFNALLELIQLAPTSYGLQPFKIKVVSDKKTKEILYPFTEKQSQVLTCSDLLVFCADSNIKARIEGYEKLMLNEKIPSEKVKGIIDYFKKFEKGLKSQKEKLSWAKRQSYIALGNALNGSKSLGFDSGPMEGFSPKDYSRILKLPKNLVPTALVAVGYAADKPRKKIRFSKKDLFF